MAQIRPLWNRIPHRPDGEAIRRSAEIAQAHSEFVDANADEVPFEPEGRPVGSDYPLRYVDIEASGAALDEFHNRVRRILGLS